VVEAMAGRIVGKMLHGPIQWLKAQAEAGLEPDYGISSLSPEQLAGLFFTDMNGTGRSVHHTPSVTSGGPDGG
jgi:hypothetical protein